MSERRDFQESHSYKEYSKKLIGIVNELGLRLVAGPTRVVMSEILEQKT